MREPNAIASVADSEALLRLAAAGYGGACLAGGVTTIAALETPSLMVLAGATLIAFLIGSAVAIALASRDRTLPARLGRSLERRLLPLVPAVAFGAVALAARFDLLDRSLTVPGFAATVAVLVAGHALARAAQTRYVEAIVGDEPAASWRWTPRRAGRLDGLLFAVSLALVLVHSIAGNSLLALFWAALTLVWAGGRIAEGRWRFGSPGTSPRLQVHDAGLVKRRPFTRSLVPWESVSRVRLREDELVLDRGLFDVRFESAELEDPEGLRAAIDRRLSNANSRPRAAD